MLGKHKQIKLYFIEIILVKQHKSLQNFTEPNQANFCQHWYLSNEGGEPQMKKTTFITMGQLQYLSKFLE